jgi:hypothetical protein
VGRLEENEEVEIDLMGEDARVVVVVLVLVGLRPCQFESEKAECLLTGPRSIATLESRGSLLVSWRYAEGIEGTAGMPLT